MHSSIDIWIAAPPEQVFELVADLERWPEHLPHYRYVHIVAKRDGITHARMSARRGLVPVFWEAEQRPDPESRTIRFRHVAGVTRGMDVLWTLHAERAEHRDGTRASITHHLDFRPSWAPGSVGRFLADHVIAPQFIEPIAGQTLRRFKALAEAGGSAARAGRRT